MLSPIPALLAFFAYTAAMLTIWRPLRAGLSATPGTRGGYRALAALGLALHAWLLSGAAFGTQGPNLDLFHAASLTVWLVVAVWLLASLKQPVDTLGIALLPSAGLTVLAESFFGSSQATHAYGQELALHIVVSVLAYSILTIAALQALLLAIQDYQLRHKHPGGFMRALPPLQTMESLLFQLISLGFMLLSLALGSGLLYLEDMFTQHLVHKTVLSIVAWSLFGVLLLGRWLAGWRGRTAIYWTLGGFFALLLAYFGSKFVLELILKR